MIAMNLSVEENVCGEFAKLAWVTTLVDPTGITSFVAPNIDTPLAFLTSAITDDPVGATAKLNAQKLKVPFASVAW
jgi:hypothetical protein